MPDDENDETPRARGGATSGGLRRSLGDKRTWLYIGLGGVALIGLVIAWRRATANGQAQIAAVSPGMPGVTLAEPTPGTPVTIAPPTLEPPPYLHGTPIVHGGPIAPITAPTPPPYLHGTPIVHGGPIAPLAPPTAPAPRTYTVRSGDTLWGIARRYYGSGAAFTRIVAANRAVIQRWSHGNANLIYPGETFVIPPVTP